MTATAINVSDTGAAVELDARSCDGIDVTLWYVPATCEVYVSLSDRKTALQAVFQVPGDRAADAFRHPFAYCKDR